MGALSGLDEEVDVAVHRRRLLVDHDVAVAAIRVSACRALCRLGYEFSSMTPLESGCRRGEVETRCDRDERRDRSRELLIGGTLT
jgi:hypothetical protein